MKVRIKKIKTKKGKEMARILKPRIIIPPNRILESKKNYNRKKEKSLSRILKEY